MKRSKARQRAIILALTIVTGMILAGGGTAAADEAGPRIDLPVPLRMPFEPLRATTPEDPRDKAPCFVGVKPALGPGTSAPGYGELDILAAACCQPSTAGSEHLPDKPGFHTAIQYSRMEMGTILSGTGRISPDDVIRQKLAAGATSYSVPTHMTMERWTLQLGYRLDDHQSILATVPSITNNMDMRSGRRMGMTTMFMNMRMNTVSALGDISALYLRDGFRDDWRRFVWGFGLQAPTGNSQVRNSSNGLVHMMMQPGTGAWAGLLTTNYSLSYGKLPDGGPRFVVTPSLTYQINTRNALGYQEGNRLNYDLNMRYHSSSALSFNLNLNGVSTGMDSTDGTIDPISRRPAYQSPATSMIDNVNNTGLSEIYVSPGLRWTPSKNLTLFGEIRLPVMQSVNGLQQVTDSWYQLGASVRF